MFEMTIWNMLQIKTYDTRFDVLAKHWQILFALSPYHRFAALDTRSFISALFPFHSDNRETMVCYLCHSIDYYIYFFGDIIVIITIIFRWSFLLANEFSTWSNDKHQIPFAELYTQWCSHIQFYRVRAGKNGISFGKIFHLMKQSALEIFECVCIKLFDEFSIMQLTQLNGFKLY